MVEIKYIYEKYKKDIYYFIYSLSQNTDVSTDITSEVFLSALTSLHTFRGDSDVKTWLFGIARNKWFEYIRKEIGIRSINEKLALYINESDYFGEYKFENKEMIDRVAELLDKEKSRDREIVLMRIDGYSFCETGKKLSISEGSARVIDFRTRKRVKQILEKEGYSYE